MELGKAWIIIEESHHSKQKHLISIISIRRNSAFVCDFVEQSYVDKYASFDEKMAYKNNKKNSPFGMNPMQNRITIYPVGMIQYLVPIDAKTYNLMKMF